ncbi:MAG: glycosyltransferase family 4 protein [Thermoflexales bacterium]|nr:glycosyltransferase family 4 protein [Thermoflexales bacterium]
MRIALIAPFAYAPKATVSARMMPIATALARRGHVVHVLIPPYDNPSYSGRRWQQDGVAIENMRLRRLPFSLAQFADLARQIVRSVQALNPEVVHVFKPVGVGALGLFGLRQAAVVDNDDWEGRGGWVDVNPYPRLLRWFMLWQERWALRRAAAVTCASTALVERSRTLGGASKPVLLFPNGPRETLRAQVARAEQQRQALRQRFGWGDEWVLIYAGTVPVNHDLDVAVQALAGLRDKPWRWAIIATGDGLPSLRQQIARAGLDRRVEWHGFMPHAQLVERLVAADIALYPYRDTLINRAKCSGKVIDYMACGKPMVVSNLGMNQVYLDGGRCGMLTPPGDAAAFRQALLQLMDNPALAHALGQAAQAHVWQAFGWEGRVQALIELYQQL